MPSHLINILENLSSGEYRTIASAAAAEGVRLTADERRAIIQAGRDMLGRTLR